MKTDRELINLCEGWVGGRNPDQVEAMTLRNKVNTAVDSIDDLIKFIYHDTSEAEIFISKIVSFLHKMKLALEEED